MVGAQALDFVQRGFDTRIFHAAMGAAAATCDQCMEAPLCVDTCPTGALVVKR